MGLGKKEAVYVTVVIAAKSSCPPERSQEFTQGRKGMPIVGEYSHREGITTFVEKHAPQGLVACTCRGHWFHPETEGTSVVQLELPRGFSFGPICTRRCVAIFIESSDVVEVNDPSWLSQVTELVAKYEKYSGRQMRVMTHKSIPS